MKCCHLCSVSVATSSGYRELMFSSVLPLSSEMHNLLVGLVFHSVIVFSCESRRIGESVQLSSIHFKPFWASKPFQCKAAGIETKSV